MAKTLSSTTIAVALMLAVVCLAGGPVLGSQTWTIEAGFSPTTNPNGVWTYGYQTSLGGPLVTYNTALPNVGIVTWSTDGSTSNRGSVNGNTTDLPVDTAGQYWQPRGVTFHPGPGDQKATIRWTSPYAASVYVSASFWGANYGSGATTDVHVLHNGVDLFAGTISGYGGGGHAVFGSSPTQAYGGALTVAAGDTIDFAVGYGNGGYACDLTGVSGWISDAPPGPAIPVINEIQSANSSTIADEDGNHPDWIEIHNAGGQSINLLDYGLSDDTTAPFKWTFPSYSLQPGQYLVVFASDKDRKTGPYFHTNYAIKSSGETISLTAPDGTLVSRIPATSISQDMSYGRKPDGSDSLFYFAIPTPGASNTSTGYIGTLTAPVFSRARGFYNSGFNVALSTTETGATIRYTTDGSAPTETSMPYTASIPIPSGADGAIFRTTPLRARVFKTDCMPSPIATNTYFVGPSAGSRYNLPIISLATDNANFFDSATGIYTNYSQEGDAWERPIHVEFFEPGAHGGFHCDAGVRIHGAWTALIPQKSLRLYADHQGGPGSFDYQVFPNSTLTDYKRLILRNWASDNEWIPSYWGYPLPPIYTLIRDALGQSLVHDLDVDQQNYRPAIVFFDGAYWGIFALMEREDKEWVKNHHPEVDEDNIDLVQQNPGYLDIAEGDATALNDLIAYLQSNDLALPANYEYAKSKIDISSFLIHNATQIYVGNNDWPGNNLRYWRPRTTDGKWRWALFDLDWAFGLITDYTHPTIGTASMRSGSIMNPDNVCVFLASILRNHEARNEFINRMADMMNTVFKPSVVVARIDAMQAELSPYLAEHFTRWGGKGNVTQWNGNIQRLRDFANGRPASVRDQFVQFFRLSGTSNLTVNAAGSSTSSVTVSTVNIPGSSLPWQGVYFNDVPIKLTAVPADGYRFVRWDGAGLGTQNPATIILTGDAAVTAVFEPGSGAARMIREGSALSTRIVDNAQEVNQ